MLSCKHKEHNGAERLPDNTEAPLHKNYRKQTQSNMHYLEAENIVKNYSNHCALDGVSIRVPKGKVFGLLGPNGAGKSTLIRIINRIIVPDSGIIRIGGRPSCQEDIYRIGYLPEERGLYKKMKVGQQAIYLAQLKGMSYADAKRSLTAWFEKFDIMPWWNKKLEELSKGMQQKVQFIITVAHSPELLIFDEPFSGFDPVNAELLKREILALKDAGHTVIFSTHNMQSVEEVCDNIALIHNSHVMLEGEVNEVRDRFRSQTYDVVVRGENHNREHFTMKSDDNTSAAELLARLSQENREVISFAERIPSMHEIFIKTVENALETK